MPPQQRENVLANLRLHLAVSSGLGKQTNKQHKREAEMGADSQEEPKQG
jgi:hypothetical protein